MGWWMGWGAAAEDKGVGGWEEEGKEGGRGGTCRE